MTRYPADNRHRIRRPIAGMHDERVPSRRDRSPAPWRFRLVRQNRHAQEGRRDRGG